MKLKYYLLVIFCGLMSACSAPKDIVYFQGVDSLSPEQLSKMSQTYSTKITYDDLLSITVAAWDPAAVTPFNPPTFAYSTEGEQPYPFLNHCILIWLIKTEILISLY